LGFINIFQLPVRNLTNGKRSCETRGSNFGCVQTSVGLQTSWGHCWFRRLCERHGVYDVVRRRRTSGVLSSTTSRPATTVSRSCWPTTSGIGRRDNDTPPAVGAALLINGAITAAQGCRTMSSDPDPRRREDGAWTAAAAAASDETRPWADEVKQRQRRPPTKLSIASMFTQPNLARRRPCPSSRTSEWHNSSGRSTMSRHLSLQSSSSS